MKTLSEKTNLRGFMNGMEDGGISRRSEVELNVAPGMVFMHVSNKSFSRRIPGRHAACVRSGTM